MKPGKRRQQSATADNSEEAKIKSLRRQRLRGPSLPERPKGRVDTEMLTLYAELQQLFKERNAKYGSNYEMVGQVMAAMFPQGYTVRTVEDHIRFHWVSWLVGKLTRWVNTGMSDYDSILDAANYAAFLAAMHRIKRCSYPQCHCAVSFPKGVMPGPTECPRALGIDH